MFFSRFAIFEIPVDLAVAHVVQFQERTSIQVIFPFSSNESVSQMDFIFFVQPIARFLHGVINAFVHILHLLLLQFFFLLLLHNSEHVSQLFPFRIVLTFFAFLEEAIDDLSDIVTVLPPL